ncbi:membrane bound O-acyl transferase, MBOAT family protein [Alkaliphilus metalliredigens QYMF]|uniref:Membrane bound O-acyl transferase, MBOAT family protein n=1 Tax=Alkaliphilus metalliredigens (strain QYMF) TaxID=293826 RepID=A6TPM5_ALKMQ|nr:MBOAT family O-acyltransferase [Alkaliphilus metalliredigens]ABR48143.1 membrane bound O-acyl transferase, MBOAT family protein [Alkaliphilus metalliredigens QYMF]
MVFSSLLFTFAFLPVTVVLYYSLGKNFKNIVLLTASLFFYAWGEPVYVVLMCSSILMNYCIGRLIGEGDVSRQKKKLYLIISLVLNLGCLAYFKYFGMIISTISSIGGWNLNVSTPALPIGISFYTFQILSYVIDVYREKIKPQKSLILCAVYITMFPQLVAGPIVNYVDIESQLTDRRMTFNKFYSGMQRFLCGLAKKVLLANNIGLLWSEVKAMPSIEISVFMAWAGIIAFTLQIYFDFSGYSDMAIGLGKMFGFRFKENFQYPYISQSITEFWRRWHISLGSWFREYVYIPLDGSRVGKKKMIRNLFIVWFITGLWHGASWNFVLWGLYFGTLLLIEKLFLQKSMTGWPKAVRHVYLLLFVVIGWVFFEFTNLNDVLNFLRLMFGIGGNEFIDNQGIVKLKAYAFLYIVCIIATTPWPKKLVLLFEKTHSSFYRVAVNLYYCGLILMSTAYMVGSTFNPFIYFRF